MADGQTRKRPNNFQEECFAELHSAGCCGLCGIAQLEMSSLVVRFPYSWLLDSVFVIICDRRQDGARHWAIELRLSCVSLDGQDILVAESGETLLKSCDIFIWLLATSCALIMNMRCASSQVRRHG